MKAMQAMLARLRASKVQPHKGPSSAKPTLADVMAKHRATKAETKNIGQWRDPSDKTFEIKVPRSMSVKELLLKLRADFRRLNVQEVKPFILQVEGLAEYRWTKWWIESHFNKFVK